MAKFRDVENLQKLVAVHVSIHSHFNHERHLDRREFSNKPEPTPWPSGVNSQPEGV